MKSFAVAVLVAVALATVGCAGSSEPANNDGYEGKTTTPPGSDWGDPFTSPAPPTAQQSCDPGFRYSTYYSVCECAVLDGCRIGSRCWYFGNSVIAPHDCPRTTGTTGSPGAPKN
jgi:hypothetical protein